MTVADFTSHRVRCYLTGPGAPAWSGLARWVRIAVALAVYLFVSPAAHAWWDSNWNARVQLTFDNSGQPQALDDFPVLVVLDPSNIDYSKTDPNGLDLRFIDADDSTVLKYEIEKWTPGGTSFVWVRVPRIDASSPTDFIYLYYDNTGAPYAQDPPGVWAVGYLAVWHMDDDPTGAASVLDSTVNAKHGTGSASMNATNVVAGQIGQATVFDGSADYVRVPSGAGDVLEINGNNLTMESWVRRNGSTPGNVWMAYFGRQLGTVSAPDSYVQALRDSDPSQALGATGGGAAFSSPLSVPTLTWRYLATTKDGSFVTQYVSGSQDGQVASGGPVVSDPNDVTIGAMENDGTANPTEWYVGELDEIRISNVTRSADWIAAQYLSMTDNFITYTGDIEGSVFEDADFAGTASAYDGGAGDKALEGVDVELYDGGTDAYITSTITAANGSYGFGGLADGSYKVRVRSSTIGSGTATPKGGLNGTVPGTWPNPLPEMSWGNGAALYGGQSPTVDDTTTGDNGGPGDTWVSVTISGASAVGVDFGFANNLIVNTSEDSNADSARSAQGSLRQFIKNANAIGSAGGTTANASEFHIPTSDPNYNVGTGVFTIAPTILLLPELADAGTTLDASTQGDNTSETNAGNLGVGGKVGVDQLDLSTVPAPEVEIAGDGTLPYGLRITAGNGTLRGLAIFGFGLTSTGEGNIFVADSITGPLIEQNVIGSGAAAFADPGAGVRGYENIYSGGADGGTIRNNLIGFGGIRGILLAGDSLNWDIDDNEVRDNSLNDPFGDGIAIDPGSADVTGNLIVGSASQGVVVKGSSGSTFSNNTISGNGIGTASTSGNAAGMTFRSTASGHTVELNEFIANYAAGLSVNDGATGITITQNSFSANGTITARNGDPATGQIGIDLNNPTDDVSAGTFPFVSLNDSGDSLPGGNNLLNYPVLYTALINGANLELTGWAPPGSVIEVFLRDTDPSLFGEGLTHQVTLTENGTGAGLEDPYLDQDTDPPSLYGPGAINGIAQGSDTTNRFRFVFSKPPAVTAGVHLTATARDGSNNTSEFGGRVIVAAVPLVIVKRAFQIDGTPIASGSSLPQGVPFKFVLYFDNPGAAVADGSVQDILDPLFAYQTNSMKIDSSLVSSVVCPGGVCDEAAIFAQVDGAGTPLGDGDALVVPTDSDEGSYSSGTTTLDVGDSSNPNNAQLDLAAGRVFAVVFTVAVQ